MREEAVPNFFPGKIDAGKIGKRKIELLEDIVAVYMLFNGILILFLIGMMNKTGVSKTNRIIAAVINAAGTEIYHETDYILPCQR
jgi:hypothetical protein